VVGGGLGAGGEQRDDRRLSPSARGGGERRAREGRDASTGTSARQGWAKVTRAERAARRVLIHNV
jgi:hypothetical protein